MEVVAFVVAYGACGVYRHATIVANTLVLTSNLVVERSLTAIRVADDGYAYVLVTIHAAKIRKKDEKILVFYILVVSACSLYLVQCIETLAIYTHYRANSDEGIGVYLLNNL